MLYFSTFNTAQPSCPHCGNDDLQRLVSTFSVQKTYKDVYNDILSDSSLVKGMLGNEPRALAEWNKRMGQGEKVAPEYEEMLGRMDRGEMPSKPDRSEAERKPSEEIA